MSKTTKQNHFHYFISLNIEKIDYSLQGIFIVLFYLLGAYVIAQPLSSFLWTSTQFNLIMTYFVSLAKDNDLFLNLTCHFLVIPFYWICRVQNIRTLLFQSNDIKWCNNISFVIPNTLFIFNTCIRHQYACFS